MMNVQNLVSETVDEIGVLHTNDSFDDFSKFITKFYSNVPAEFLRNATMELIIQIHNRFSTTKPVISKIYKTFESFLKEKEDDFVNTVACAEVPESTWANAWEICFNNVTQQKTAKDRSALEVLFHIREPETSARKVLINKSVRKLLGCGNEVPFNKGIGWILTFDLETLKEEEFENILYNSYIYVKGRGSIGHLFKSSEDKLRCLQILDDCLVRAERRISPKSDAEKDFLKAVPVETLAEVIHKRAQTYGIDTEKHRFYSYKVFFIQQMKRNYSFMDRRYFELYALDALKDRDEKYKLDFLEVISHDKKYAYSWSKKLKISQENMPLFLQNCKHFESGLKKIPEITSFFVTKDSTETCKFWGKSYKLITVITEDGFDDFVEKYFVKQRPKILGIDCEANGSASLWKSFITVLQLATPEWICLIDVHVLFDKISKTKWKNFFQLLFHPSITRIGFSFQNDYIFMLKKFPFLSYLITEKQRKVFCLQNLANTILEDQRDISSSIFTSKLSVDSGLAKLTKAVLNIDLDKSLQQSNWTQRPLTQLQKIYAVSDAIIVILIKDEIEKRLEKRLGNSAVKKLINKGFVTYDKDFIKTNGRGNNRVDYRRK